jgi:hypothetical protein
MAEAVGGIVVRRGAVDVRLHVLLLGQRDLALIRAVAYERLEPGVPLGDDPENIMDLPLEPVRRRDRGGYGRIRVRVHTRAHHDHRVIRAHDRSQLPVAVAVARREQHHQPPADPSQLRRERAGVDGSLCCPDHTRPPITVVAACSSRFNGLGIQTPSTSTTARLATIATAISGCSGRRSRARSAAVGSHGEITMR